VVRLRDIDLTTERENRGASRRPWAEWQRHVADMPLKQSRNHMSQCDLCSLTQLFPERPKRSVRISTLISRLQQKSPGNIPKLGCIPSILVHRRIQKIQLTAHYCLRRCT